jgi:hypothetical protein
MCAVVKSYQIKGLNETNAMPMWWHTSHWRLQYPADPVVSCNADIQTLHNTAKDKVQMGFMLCPPYSGAKNSGRPREEKQIKGSVELSMEKKKSAKSNKKRTVPIEPEDKTEYRTLKKKKKKKSSKARGRKDKESLDDEHMLISDLSKSKGTAVKKKTTATAGKKKKVSPKKASQTKGKKRAASSKSSASSQKKTSKGGKNVKTKGRKK